MLELREALAIEAGDFQINLDNRPQAADIISARCGLAVWHHESGFVGLVHRTAQEYLSDRRELVCSEDEIGAACVRYVSMAAFESGACASAEELERRLWSRPLYQYAALS